MNQTHATPPEIRCISALTLATHDMGRALAFYQSMGFRLLFGGADAEFSSLSAGSGYLNLTLQDQDRHWQWWGRTIFYTQSVDGTYRSAIEAGLTPQFAPRDASWGERYFHITDPDGHELSFAQPLDETKTEDNGKRA